MTTNKPLTRLQNVLFSMTLVFFFGCTEELEITPKNEAEIDQSKSSINIGQPTIRVYGNKGEVGTVDVSDFCVGKLIIGEAGCQRKKYRGHHQCMQNFSFNIPNNIRVIPFKAYDRNGNFLTQTNFYPNGTTSLETKKIGKDQYEVSVNNSGSNTYNWHSEYNWTVRNDAGEDIYEATTEEPKLNYTHLGCESEELDVFIAERSCEYDPYFGNPTIYHNLTLDVSSYENLTYTYEQIAPFRARFTARGGDGCNKVYRWMVLNGNIDQFLGPSQVIFGQFAETLEYTFHQGDNYLRLAEFSPEMGSSRDLYVKSYVISFNSSGDLYFAP